MTFFTVHESLEKASLLRDTALAFSFIIHVSFFASLHYLVGSNLQTDCSRQFFYFSFSRCDHLCGGLFLVTYDALLLESRFLSEDCF